MELIKNCVALDTESRRLPGSSTYHWLSVAVVGPGGAILHMPVRPIGLELEEIEMFNNPPFSPEILFQANPPSVVRNMVKELLRGLTVLVWNEKHEAEQLAFLNEKDQLGRKVFRVQDVMRRAAPYVKHWNDYFSDYEYPSLQMTATHLDIEFTEPGWHDARADAQMILDIWRYMESNPPFQVNRQTVAPERALPAPGVIDNNLPF